jgi:hypothetical protein
MTTPRGKWTRNKHKKNFTQLIHHLKDDGKCRAELSNQRWEKQLPDQLSNRLCSFQENESVSLLKKFLNNNMVRIPSLIPAQSSLLGC